MNLLNDAEVDVQEEMEIRDGKTGGRVERERN